MARPITPILATVGATLALSAVATTSSSAAVPSSGGLAVSSAAPRASTSSSAAVGPQKTWTGKTAPVDLPGTGIEQGDRLPKGKKIETAAQSGSFGSGVINRNYVGTRSVTIRAAGGQKGAEGRLYAFAR